MQKNLYIVTGTSSGIGKKISIILLKKNQVVLGISRNRLNVKHRNFKFIKHDFKFKFNVKKIHKYIKRYKYLYIICAAGTRTGSDNSLNGISDSLNINFFNQVNLVDELKKKINIKRVTLFSSFNIFRKKIDNIGYNSAKKIIFEITKNDKSKIYQCYIMGNITTSMSKRHPSILKSLPLIGNYLEKKISIKPDYIAKKVISHLENNIKKTFYYPNIHPFLIKYAINFLEIINKLLYKK